MSYEYNSFKNNSYKVLNEQINVDLHIHSIASKYKEGKIRRKDGTEVGIVDESDFSHIDVLLSKLNEKNINMFAFTDHNRFNCELFVKTAELIESTDKYNNIMCLLPGVEFDVKIEKDKDSCHIITIFDAKSNADLEKIESSIKKKEYYLDSKEKYYDLNMFEMLMKEIGLNTIFIACQRKSLDNPSGGANSISDSVSDIYEFLQVGFINALEYQKSNVEGMLLNNLKDFPRQMGLVCGSDCHQWSVYPLHDELDNNFKNKRYFSIKALPTFLGLLLALTSPETRFRRKTNENAYYDGISIRDKLIPLSDGINVIIGENGSGKSTLLTAICGEKLATYQKKLLSNNKIEVLPNNIKYKFVAQNSIIEKSQKSDQLFSNSQFKNVDNTIFEKNINQFSLDLLNFINTSIQLNENCKNLKESKIILNADLYYSKTYYVDINISQLKTINNVFKERLSNLNTILITLKDEILTKNIYNKDEIKSLKESYNNILLIRNSVADKYKQLYLKNEVINNILSQVKDYKKNITTSSTEEDELSTTYKNTVQKFQTNCIEYIRNGILTNRVFPIFKLDLIKSISGMSENKENGYKFIKKTKYYKNDGIIDELYKTIFNSDYRGINKIKKLDTIEEFSAAITGANKSNYKDVFKERVKKFIDAEEDCICEVLEASSQQKMGNTLGEKSLVYYKYLTYEENNEYNILYIDQPEDNISNIRIASDLKNYLNNLRNNKQIIFVTHNPLLVINLDVDNVIIMENKGGKIDIQSGCLEYNDNLNRIAELLDGGKELIEKRLKLYYGR